MKCAAIIAFIVPLFVFLTPAKPSESCEEKLQAIRTDLQDAGITIRDLRKDLKEQGETLAGATKEKEKLENGDKLKTEAFNKMSTKFVEAMHELTETTKQNEHLWAYSIGLTALIVLYIGLKIYPATRMFIP